MVEDGRVAERLLAAGAGEAIGVLAVSRSRIEAAEWHLRRIVELGERLASRRNMPDVDGEDGNEGLAAYRKALDSDTMREALATVERASAALAELAKWEGRSIG